MGGFSYFSGEDLGIEEGFGGRERGGGRGGI